MLLELAIGDAYGAGFEYANANVECCNDLSAYVKHPTHRGLMLGHYTDDTQMSLAIAEMILDEVEWSPLNLASKFVEVFHRDPREGYSQNFYVFLKSVHSGEEFLQKMHPDSDKSGAAMRATPLGIFPRIPEVIEKTSIQAAVTHNTPNGIQAALAAALSAHYFMYQLGEKKHLGEFLVEHIQGEHQWDTFYQGKVKSKGWMSVRAAITAIRRNNSQSDLLMDCINFTGDVDTVATIALGASAYSPEIEADLPKHLKTRLENGAFGRDYIIALDQRFDAKLQTYRASTSS